MSGPGFIQGVPNFDKLEIVVIGNTSVSATASPTNWSTTPHNLGYKPIVIAFLNNVDLSGVATGVDAPLPSYGGLTVVTGAGNEVRFTSWIHAIVDTTNLYIVLFNSTGAPISSLPIKYYLLRERSS